MTHEERIDALEAILARYEAYFYFGHNVEGDPYVMTRHGFHICTNYHAEAPRAEGAVFSVSTDKHHWVAYFGKDHDTSGTPNVPGPAIYVENVRPGAENIGIQIECANATSNLGIRINSQHSIGGPYPGRATGILVSDGAETRWLCIGPDGFVVVGNTPTLWAVRAPANSDQWQQAKALWP